MRFQPGGVIGDQRVGGGVGLVEAVTSELVEEVEQFIGLAAPDVVGGSTGAEALALGGHLGLDLLAHRSAQEVGFAQ